MDWFAWLVLITVGLVFVLLASNRFSPDQTLLGALVFLMVLGGDRFSPGVALSGFSNQGMLTIAVLFVVACGVSAGL